MSSPDKKLFSLPILNCFGLFIKRDIGIVTAFGYFAPLYRSAYFAALFAGVGAGRELALSDKGCKLPKIKLQIFLDNKPGGFTVHRGKSRGIANISVVLKLEKLGVAGGVASPPQLFAYLSRLKSELRVDNIKKRGFAHAGISRKNV